MKKTIKITKSQLEELRNNYVLKIDDMEIHLTYGCNFMCGGRYINFKIDNKIITSLDDYDNLINMKSIKVFYLDNEVASFNNVVEAIQYIEDMLKVDKKLHKNQFTIYSKIAF